MQKKPGQISSSTLGLRFMQIASREKQEREVEAAKAKVQTEEEWELPPNVRESWGIERKVDGQSVSYEPSYIPFLFLSTSGEGSTHHPNVEEEAMKEDCDVPPASILKGRRTFGKHHREETQEDRNDSAAVPQLQKPKMELPRGARSISSHGRAAASSKSSSSSSPSKPISHPPNQPLTSPPASVVVKSPQGFVKPNVDAPRVPGNADSGKKRTMSDRDLGDKTDASKLPGNGAKKRKRRKDNLNNSG